ncbi:hypothetical protein KXR83_05765 [Williamsia muralis]|uniref:hypothetical protein n=1 Tax=Williamsia marianensis TaxID=85044 RepID=UPI003F189BA3
MTMPFLGQFADFEDVKKRYRGQSPMPDSDREWVEEKIIDVEAILLGLLPSLNGTTDPGRRARAKSLVCEKVLDLRRGARGLASRTAEGFGETYVPGSVKTSISFSEAELKPLRLRRKRRYGMIPVDPWRPGGV